MRGVSGLLVLLFCCAACSTPSMRVLADPQRGFEADGPRTFSLAYDRVAVKTVEGEERIATVRLPMRARNDSDAPWVVRSRDFIVLEPQAGGGSARLAPEVGDELVAVEPGGRAEFELPLVLRPADDDAAWMFVLRGYVEDEGEGRLVFERELVVDRFRPGAQVAYAGGFGVLLLGVFLLL